MIAGPEKIGGIGAIADLYDLFLIDQYGVLHDGQALYPGALDAVTRLTAAGKAVVILTNSGKPAAPNVERLARLGVPPDRYDRLVSSGDVAQAAIRSGSLGPPFETGRRVHIVGRRGEDYGFAGLDLAFVEDASEADFLLIVGSDAPERSLQEQMAPLIEAARAGTPALCSNPDLQMLTESGLQPAPGTLAAAYAALGGPVVYIGKPYMAIYAHVLGHYPQIDRARVLAVGDSLVHDIKGGVMAGLRTALVRTGVAASLNDEDLNRSMAAHAFSPNWLLPYLLW